MSKFTLTIEGPLAEMLDESARALLARMIRANLWDVTGRMLGATPNYTVTVEPEENGE